jgi:HSP20 family protein
LTVELDVAPRRRTAYVQTPPVRLYCSAARVMLAVPLPGLRPQDITVTVTARRVTIEARSRGPREETRDHVLAEWWVGPYYREVVLPGPVNGVLANATYGNGVLVLALPKLDPGQPSADAAFRLEADRPPRGVRVGHAGRTRQPTSTEEHRQKRATAARAAHHAHPTRPLPNRCARS